MKPNPDRRSKRRVDIAGDITVFYKAGTRRHKGRVVNLSSIGALLEIDPSGFYLGKLIEFAFIEQDGHVPRIRHHTAVVTHVSSYGAGILLLSSQHRPTPPETCAKNSS